MNDLRRTPNVISLDIILIAGSLLAAAGCPGADPAQGGSGGTDGVQDPMGPGHQIQCCFQGTIDDVANGGGFKTAAGCEQEVAWDCIDPVADDLDGDGTLSDAERRTYCNAHCTPFVDDLFASVLPWVGNTPDDVALLVGAGNLFKGCGATSGVIKNENFCQPTMPEVYDGVGTYVPTHEVLATSGGAGNTVGLTINRALAQPTWSLEVALGLYECNAQGINGGTCSLAMRSLQLATTGPFTVGDFSVTASEITLINPEVATIRFAPCSGGACTGTFEISVAHGNSLDTNLSWDQVTISTGSLGGGYLHLSNGPSGLGGLDAIAGTLTVDTSGNSGTLRLVGSGADRLGNGDYASLRFDITGPVTPYSG